MRVLQTEFLTPETLTSETEKLWVYNGLDCCLTHEIHGTLRSLIDPVADRTYRLSLALQAPILEMNMRGVRVDLEKRDALVTELGREAEALQRSFDRLCLGVFERTVNPNSPAQVKALLYDWLHLPVQKSRNTKGEYVATADRESLEKLAGMYPTAKLIVAFILAMRDKLKLAATLQTSLSDDNRFRTNFSIAGTRTGRLASSMSDFSDGSNMQNLDRRIRNIFIADPGMKLANIDLEQADARNVGLMCWLLFGADTFLNACDSGDLHTTVTRMCWTELPWTDDPKANRKIADQPAYRENSYRDLAKKLGHGTNFNGQPPTMAMHTKVEKKFIESFQQRYFGAFPEVRQRIDWVAQKLLDDGYLTTVYGRRRHFFKRRNDNKTLNEACAYDPQSMTADAINYGMLRAWHWGKAQLLLQVHDSILFQYPEELEDEIVPVLKDMMEVPLTVKGRRFVVPCEVQTGWSWGYPTYEKGTGRIIDNFNGMVKYRGTDNRQRV